MIKKYLPVWVEENGVKKISGVDFINCRNENGDYLFWARPGELESSPLYSADELLEVIRKVGDMPCGETKKLYGEEYYGDLYKKCSASEIIEKYREYESTPKVGDLYKNRHSGCVAAVTKRSEIGRIYYAFADGSCDYKVRDEFDEYFDKLDGNVEEPLKKFLASFIEVDE